MRPNRMNAPGILKNGRVLTRHPKIGLRRKQTTTYFIHMRRRYMHTYTTHSSCVCVCVQAYYVRLECFEITSMNVPYAHEWLE